MRGQPKRGQTKKKGRWNGYMEGVGGGTNEFKGKKEDERKYRDVNR